MESEPPAASASDRRSVLSVGKGTTIMAVSTFLLLLFSFASRTAVARAFNPQTYGVFNLGLALTGLLSVSALLGLHQAIARTIAHERDAATRRRVLSVGVVVSAAAAVIASTVVFEAAYPLAAVFNTPMLAPTLQLLSVTIGFILLSTFLAAIFQGLEDTAPNAIYNQIVAPGLFLLFLFVFLFLHLGFTGTIVAYVVANGVAFVALALHAVRTLPGLIPAAAGPPARLPPHLLSLSVSLWGVTSFQFVTAYADTLILGVFRPGGHDVGIYSAAMTLARLLLVGNGALTYIFLPVAARLKREGGYDTLRTTYVTSTRWVLVITMPMLFLFLFLPVQSLHAVFGQAYISAAIALSITVVGSFLSVIEGPANSALAGMGYARQLLLTTVVAGAVNLVLSFTLIPPFGLIGAAVAWSVARAIYPGLGAYLLWLSDRITPFRRVLVLPLAVALAIGTPIFLAAAYFAVPAWTVVPFFFVGALVFLGAILLTHTVDRGDLVALGGLEKRLGRPFPRLHRFLERYVGPSMATGTGSG